MRSFMSLRNALLPGQKWSRMHCRGGFGDRRHRSRPFLVLAVDDDVDSAFEKTGVIRQCASSRAMCDLERGSL